MDKGRPKEVQAKEEEGEIDLYFIYIKKKRREKKGGRGKHTFDLLPSDNSTPARRPCPSLFFLSFSGTTRPIAMKQEREREEGNKSQNKEPPFSFDHVCFA